MKQLPDFNENPSNVKNEPLTQADVDKYQCRPITLRLLQQTADRLNKSPDQVRVLDYGCGRGETVAYLRRCGYDCYGVEIEPTYVKSAQAFLGSVSARFPVVSLVDDTRTLFPDDFFDVVLTDQVLEHVSVVEPVIAELKRIMGAGSVALHIFPSSWCLVEPHMFLPVVHWLPKGAARRILIRAMLAMGMGAPYFENLSSLDRGTIFFLFSVTGTFYRTRSELTEILRWHGFLSRGVAREKLLCRGGLAARVMAVPILGRIAAGLYGTLHQTYLLTAKDPSALTL
jgi:SAM-dependent methyltransferase